MEWTSIQEKYPNETGDYLVSGGGKIWIEMFIKLTNIHGFCNDCKNPTIEAWMPLPEPYLLKEQDAVEPTLIREGRNKHYNDYVCPRCGNEVVYEQNYCSECGVRFLWKGR